MQKIKKGLGLLETLLRIIIGYLNSQKWISFWKLKDKDERR